MPTGIRDTSSTYLSTQQLQIDMTKQIALLEPNAAPLIVLLKNLNKEKSIAYKFDWTEDVLQGEWDTIDYSTGYTTGDTSMVVTTIALFAPRQLIEVVSTGEIMKVLTVTTGTDTITVTRSYGETVAQNIAHEADLHILSMANEQGAERPTILTTKIEEIYNYCQIFRKSWGVTETEKHSAFTTEDDWTYQGKKKGIEHIKDIEKAFWFGERAITVGEDKGKVEAATRGILRFLELPTTQEKDAGGTLTEAEFDEYIRVGFTYGTEKKILFAGSLLLAAVSFWAKGKLVMYPKDETYGISIFKYISPHGVINIIHNKLFSRAASVYTGYGVLLDMDKIKYRFLQGRDTMLKTNRQANSEDSRVDELLTECGLQLKNPECHYILSGITGWS